MGSPVDHSLSPVLHRAGYAALGLTQWSYERIDCDEQALPGLVGLLDESWRGLSVTMPAKAAAAAAASSRSARVELLGVANTLVRNNSAGNTGWFAENTDVDGVIGALRAHGVHRPGTVLVLGGGGTALSAIAAITELAADAVVIAGRRPESCARAMDLARRLGLPATACSFTAAALTSAARGADLVISTVPAGVADAFAGMLADVPVLLDVVYHPWPTPLAAAGAADRVTVTGLDVLLNQALRQFELFTGRQPPAAAMRDALLSNLGSPRPLPIVDNPPGTVGP
ncbi:MAG: shikimate dehydrogenase [Actinomycetota bacterium]|nr:shikimate dehydrogenase [Actinomycetota bacterium]